jgi:hypothetical protein
VTRVCWRRRRVQRRRRRASRAPEAPRAVGSSSEPACAQRVTRRAARSAAARTRRHCCPRHQCAFHPRSKPPERAMWARARRHCPRHLRRRAQSSNPSVASLQQRRQLLLPHPRPRLVPVQTPARLPLHPRCMRPLFSRPTPTPLPKPPGYWWSSQHRRSQHESGSSRTNESISAGRCLFKPICTSHVCHACPGPVRAPNAPGPTPARIAAKYRAPRPRAP